MRKEPTKKARIHSGPIVRTRVTQKQYNSYRLRVKVNDDCVFCDPKEMAQPQNKGDFIVLGNRFGYEIWDGCKVLDHLMIIPTRHIGSIREMTQSEKIQYTDLLGEYEARGYAVYSRAVGGATRSVAHLHTHLIKLDSQPIKSLVYLEKPHVLFYRK